MGWRPLPRIAFAICTYPFQSASPADLPLEIGDELYIIEQGGAEGGWYRGYLVAPPSLLAGLTSVKGQTLEARVYSGIFPRCCVEVREVLGDDKLGRQARDSEVQDATPGATRDGPPNGIATPSPSATPSPVVGHGLRHQTMSSLDGASEMDGKRWNEESKTVSKAHKSDNSHHVLLPLSPISVESRDPNAPKPIAPVPMLKIGDETTASLQEPLIDEIASCLREWHSTKLHELMLARRYRSLEKMSALVKRLDTARRQLLHKVLTDYELVHLREAVTWDLVAGNKMLSGEVIVRDPSQKGRILTAEDSAIEITKLQAMMSVLNERPTPPAQDEHTLHHIMVNIVDSVGELTQATTIAMYLCIKTPGMPPTPVSEVFAVDLATKESAKVRNERDMRTLFVDLSAADLGEGAQSDGDLYLVLKALTNEPTRNAALAAAAEEPRDSTGSSSPTNGTHTGSIKGGRRSLMWGSRSKREPPTPTAGEPTKIRTAENRPSTSNMRAPSTTQAAKSVKRTVGVGVLLLREIAKEGVPIEEEVAMWTPVHPEDDALESGGMESVIKDLIRSPTGKYKKLATPNRLQLHVQGFADPEADSLIKKTPTLLHNILQTRKIGFSGAPTKPRSDIYITLKEPSLPKTTMLAHPKTGIVPLTLQTGLANLQLTLEVRRSSGERIENCIYPSCNSAGHTAWRTTAIERGEPWNLTIRLAIEPEDVPGSHIVMSVADAPGFPFALCWMPLWFDEAFTRDGDHSLILYKYDEYTSSMISGRGAYLQLPWDGTSKEGPTGAANAKLALSTFLCSTKYSQDPILLGVLKWRDEDSAGLQNLLKRFVFVPEIEIVKLLNEVFDSLFEILLDYGGSAQYEDLVFNALVRVLGIVYDRRFDLGPLVDRYAETRFKYPKVTSCLIRSFTRLLYDAVDPDASRRLRQTVKVGNHILKLIMSAWLQQSEKDIESNVAVGHANFSADVKNIFRSLETLMRNPAPILVGTKTLIVQHFHSWLPQLSGLLPPMDIFQVANGFVESCEGVQGRLILYKLVMIIHFAELDVFRIPDTRRALRSSTRRWLAPYWGKTEDVTEQYRDQVRLCCSAVASQVGEQNPDGCDYILKLVDSYRAIQAAGPLKERTSLSLLFPTSYPFHKRTTTTTASFDEALIEISATLAAVTNSPSAIHLDIPPSDLPEFLYSILQVYISILNAEAFPTSWLSVHSFHHKSAMRTLEKLASILIDSFLPHPDEADQFNTELWRAFFDALLKLVASDALALETFPEQKRRAVWKIAGDVRELGADLLRRCWEAIGWETSPDERTKYGMEKMGGFQVQYVPGLVEAIVELCLSVHDQLRGVAVEVLETMIISEWTLSQDLSLIQAEMIDCLDKLCQNKDLTESLSQKAFVAELEDAFIPLAQEEPDDPLFLAVHGLLITISELLDMLAAVHSTESVGEAIHLMETLRLMNFMKNVQKEDIYIRYVHQLAQVQARGGNSAEAGLALHMHADLYEWEPDLALEATEDPAFPAQSSFERKEQLYFQMIKYFEDGSSWDHALECYLELAAQYEQNTFDFAKLARTQRSMATVYENIVNGERANPRYFRVVYKGLGFPQGLRDKQFIFEGTPTDRLSTFTDRLQQHHPAAQILSHDNEEDIEGQYLEIYPVNAQKDLTHPVYQRMKVAQPIRDYFLLSRLQRFTTTSRRQLSADGNAREHVVEKTLYITAEPFPTILKRSEIIAVDTVILSPLQTAIERTTRKTAELTALEKRVVNGDDSAISQITDALLVSLDAANNASISLYRDLLSKKRRRDDNDDSDAGSSSSSEEDEEEEKDEETRALENALRIALLEYTLAVKRSLAVYSRPAQQATKADLMNRLESTFATELETLNGRSSAQPPTMFSSGSARSWTLQSPPPPTSNTGTGAAPNNDLASPKPTDVEKLAIDPFYNPKTSTMKSPLSLTFLKRASLIDSIRSPQTAKSSDDIRTDEFGRIRSGARHNRFSWSKRPSTSQTRVEGGSAGGSEERAQSATGSVRKRLSLIGRGK